MAHTKQETALTGLTNKEVLESREKFGMNLLTPPKRPSMWKQPNFPRYIFGDRHRILF